MAKRDIPEINAGSMADIAFLLLIFFLVTTTMDRDQAYKRKIPKKLEIEIEPEPIMKRDIFAISANAQGQVRIVDRLNKVTDLDILSEKIVEFYRMNQSLSAEESQSAMANLSHPGNNYPFYSRITMSGINGELDRAEENLEDAEEAEADELIEFYENVIDEWNKKKLALRLYGKSFLPEISSQAHIRIESQKGTTYELYAKFHSEIEEALYELRDDAAMDIFNESYGNIVQRYELNQADPNKQTEVKEDKERIGLLKTLYPDRIIEVKPK